MCLSRYLGSHSVRPARNHLLCSLHYVHEMMALVLLSACLNIYNRWTEVWYERYAIGAIPNSMVYFPTVCNKKTAVAGTCGVVATQAPSNIG
jgi:hypothetical protein